MEFSSFPLFFSESRYGCFLTVFFLFGLTPRLSWLNCFDRLFPLTNKVNKRLFVPFSFPALSCPRPGLRKPVFFLPFSSPCVRCEGSGATRELLRKIGLTSPPSPFFQAKVVLGDARVALTSPRKPPPRSNPRALIF